MSDSNPKWLSVYLRAKWLWIQVSMLSLQTLRLVWERSSFRCSHPVVFLRKGFLKIYSKFTGEHPCWSVISLLGNFIEIILWHGCFPVNLLHIFRTNFPENTYSWLLLELCLVLGLWVPQPQHNYLGIKYICLFF